MGLCVCMWSLIISICYMCILVYAAYPAIREDYVPSPDANQEYQLIIDGVLKRLFMILYALKYVFKTHSKDSLTH